MFMNSELGKINNQDTVIMLIKFDNFIWILIKFIIIIMQNQKIILNKKYKTN